MVLQIYLVKCLIPNKIISKNKEINKKNYIILLISTLLNQLETLRFLDYFYQNIKFFDILSMKSI